MDKVEPSLPLVSVIIPSYNHESYITECLKSVYEQDYTNFEVIIRDDGSTDNSPSIIQSFIMNADNTNNISSVLEFGTNIGLVKSFNWLINNSKGDIIIICASDDVFLPHRIKVAVEMHKNYSHVDLIASNAIVIATNGEIIRQSFYDMSKRKPFNNNEEAYVYISLPYKEALSVGFGGFGMSFKRDLLRSVDYKLPESLLFEDGFLAFLAAIQNGIVLLKRPWLKYRRSENNISHLDQSLDEKTILGNEKSFFTMLLSLEMNKLQYLITNLEVNSEINKYKFNSINFIKQRIIILKVKLSVIDYSKCWKLWFELFWLLFKRPLYRETVKILILCISRKALLKYIILGYRNRASRFQRHDK